MSVHELSPESAGVTVSAAVLAIHRLASELHGGEAVEAAVLAQQRRLLVCQRPPLHHLLPVHPTTNQNPSHTYIDQSEANMYRVSQKKRSLVFKGL